MPRRTAGEKFLPPPGFIDRMKALYESFGGRAHLAEKIKISPSQLFRYTSADPGEPGLGALIRISRETGRSLDWLVFGVDAAEYEYVPRYDVAASAGYGIDVQSEQIVDYHAFRRDWLKDRRLSAKKVLVIEARGDSMAPTIAHGDFLLVDTSKRDPAHEGEGIYIIGEGEALKAKRLRRLTSGDLEIISDNRDKYPRELVTADGARSLRVIGRVHSRYGEIT